jgi:redox-regulated HSP33 family molecular chaperone
LASFPTEEMAEMVVEGVISVVCQFCNTEERFTLAEISAT